MKFKKILSTALIIASLLSVVAAAVPITASAAYAEHTVSASISADAVQALKLYAGEDGKYQYASAQQMLDTELSLGYVDTFEMTTADGGRFALCVNRYTGVMYYVNRTTGQILTSNPYDTSMIALSDSDRLMTQLKSQVILEYSDNSLLGSVISNTNDSYQLAAKKYQVTLSAIRDGFRVSYTIGDTTKRYLAPAQIRHDDFVEKILMPIYEPLMAIFEEHIGGDPAEYDFFRMEAYGKKQAFFNEGKVMNYTVFRSYLYDMINKRTGTIYKIEDDAARSMALTYQKDIQTLFTDYYLWNPFESSESGNTAGVQNVYYEVKATMGEDPEDYADDVAIFAIYSETTGATGPLYTPSKVRKFADIIRKYNPDYTMTDMYADEAACGFEYIIEEKPIFRLALEYRLDEDGSLLVSLPAGSISYDATRYTVTNITVLPFFGAGNAADADGYAFYPDGSGTVMQFGDFYNDLQMINIALDGQVYGEDYAYSDISGSHKEQITLPVYGIVNDVAANEATRTAFGLAEGATVRNGFLAILEEGASLSKLSINLDGGSSPYLSMYCSYTPYAIDTFNLSAVMSNTTGSGKYTVISEVPYSGNYTQRFTMLCDPALAISTDAPFVSSYVGMAQCYRAYLEKTGVLTALTEAETTEQLPLYIESLGSMEIDSTFLTFPVVVDVPLTSFDNVQTMYDRLKTEGIKNVNFRLTGFANGGMYATYPVRVRWERACGGKRDLRELVEYAKSLNAENGEVLGLYPEFDFMYINYTAIFDGIGRKNNVSRMLDNRYAVKRERDVSTNAVMDSYRSTIAAEALDRLYGRFVKKYQKYDLLGLSASTMGSDLSSNLDEDATVSREEEMRNVMSALSTMSSQYSLMLDKGNAYTLAYADHLLNVSLDSSHFRASSYTVPFVGMVLHGYVNFAGSPLNESGSPDYDLLRSIENGATLYYILCYQNIEHMKKYQVTSKYYSVDFNRWFDDVVETYNVLNEAIGGLQDYRINNHRLLIGERVVSMAERERMYTELTTEYLASIDAQLKSFIDNRMAEMQVSGSDAALAISVDKTALLAQYKDTLLLDADDTRYVLDAEFKADLIAGFEAELAALANAYETQYPNVTGAVVATFADDSFVYSTVYDYLTVSTSTDGDAYDSTIFTNDNGNIVIVTYENAQGQTEEFILNYNIFAVTVNYDGYTFTLDPYGFTNTRERGA